MKVLSWDVGIKNLAYCLISKTNDEFKIEKWDVINLSSNEKTCKYINRNNSVCGKNANFQVYNKDEKPFLPNKEETSFYCCKNHKDKFVPCFRTRIKIIPCLKCGNNSIKGLKGNYYYSWCSEHYQKEKIKFLKQIKSKKIGAKKCTHQDIQMTAYKLCEILDKNKKYFLDVDEILIENQPSFKNPSMKTIASLLLGYFVIRGINEKEKNNSKITKVKFVSPSNKLKINTSTTNKVLKKGKQENCVYKLTKKLGVKYCQALITKKNKEKLNTYKKKDDLCDAFLQGFQHMFSPVPEEYMNKLKKVDASQ